MCGPSGGEGWRSSAISVAADKNAATAWQKIIKRRRAEKSYKLSVVWETPLRVTTAESDTKERTKTTRRSAGLDPLLARVVSKLVAELVL